MYPTRLFPLVVPVAAGISVFTSWTVVVASILGLLMLLLVVRSIGLRRRVVAADSADPADSADFAMGGRRA